MLQKYNVFFILLQKKRIFSKQKLITLINPSKSEVKTHLRELKKIIKSHEGLSQEKLIDLLNPVIEYWTLSKRQFSTFRLFQKLDIYVYSYLWDWAKKRHPMMAESKIRSNYFHKLGNQSSVFAKKLIVNNTETYKKLFSHSLIKVGKLAYIKNPDADSLCENSMKF